MKKLFNWLVAGAFACTALAASADVYTPYDGPTGLSHGYFNDAGKIKWNTPGGDRIGDMVSETVIGGGRVSPVVVDIAAAAGAEGVLFYGKNPIKFRSRESTTGPGPYLTIDGQPTDITIVADANLSANSTLLGPYQTLSTGTTDFVVFFSEPLPVGATSITITFDVYNSYTYPVTLQAFKTAVPRVPDEPVAMGLAANYVNDAGIENDPAVLLSIDFDNPEWNAVTNWRAEQERCKTVETEFSIDGGKALQSLIESDVYGTGCSHHAHVAYWNNDVQIEEAYMRYYVRLGADYHGSSDGGKMPGISSEHWYDGFLLCGGGGTSCAGGLKGWTLRGGFDMSKDVNNPIYPGVPFHTYAYHGNQGSSYGDGWWWGARGIIPLEKWTSVEQHVKMNTPGVNDGVYEVWIDGKIALRKTDIMLRGPLPFDPRVGESPMAIKSIPWIVHFYGGKYPPGVTDGITNDHTALFDKFVVATSYIGPLSTEPTEPPPPPPPLTLEERVTDLERRVTDLEAAP